MDMNIIYTIIKSFSINIFSFLIFFKITNHKEKSFIRKLELGILVIFLAFLYVILRQYLNIIITVIIIYFLQAIILKILTKIKLSNIMISVIIAVSLSYFIYIVSGTIEFLFQNIFNINDKTINLIITAIIELVILLLFFKIKRLKNGFSFLQKENEYIDIAMTNISAILIFAYCLLATDYEKLTEYMYCYFIVLGIFFIIMIEKSLELCYKQNLLKKAIEDYKIEIKEKDEKIQKLSEEKFKISKLNHDFYNRQKALELKVNDMLTEAGEEIDVLSRIKNLSKEYSEDLQKIKGKPKLPLTDIPEIDDMFKYMQDECCKNNIDFKLQIEGSIYYLINNIISKNKLETMIGDHIRDAIIAINSSSNKYRDILVILGMKDNLYELCIYDTGIEFEIDTLLKLGLERVTTHKETGGSGIGFMTTFETIKECKASLIIQERHPISQTDYTKAVIIRFDGKNEYKICSYRAEEIEAINKDDRIIVEKI